GLVLLTERVGGVEQFATHPFVRDPARVDRGRHDDPGAIAPEVVPDLAFLAVRLPCAGVAFRNTKVQVVALAGAHLERSIREHVTKLLAPVGLGLWSVEVENHALGHLAGCQPQPVGAELVGLGEVRRSGRANLDPVFFPLDAEVGSRVLAATLEREDLQPLLVVLAPRIHHAGGRGNLCCHCLWLLRDDSTLRRGGGGGSSPHRVVEASADQNIGSSVLPPLPSLFAAFSVETAESSESSGMSLSISLPISPARLPPWMVRWRMSALTFLPTRSSVSVSVGTPNAANVSFSLKNAASERLVFVQNFRPANSWPSGMAKVQRQYGAFLPSLTSTSSRSWRV